MELELDNPLCLHFNPRLDLNGHELRASHGCAVTYNPCLPDGMGIELEAKWAVEHYSLDTSYGWVIYRNVEPERSVRTQNAPDFGKNFGQARDILLRCCLSADLFLHAVVAQRVVRRGCDAAMDALVGQRFQDFEAVTDVDCVKLYGYLPPIFCVPLKCYRVYL